MARKPKKSTTSRLPEKPVHEDVAVFAPETDLGEPLRGLGGAPLPDPNRKLGRTGPVWFLLGIVATILLVAVVWLVNPGQERGTPLQATAGAPGGVEVPTPTPAPPSPTPLPPTPTPLPVLAPGDRVVVANTAGGGIRLRADADTASITYEIYDEGALFTVLEPSSNYESYPVEKDGYRWYRVQAADGLTGWTVQDYLAPAPENP